MINLNIYLFTGLSHNEIVGNGIIFLIAGYETTSTALNFLTYALAVHPDVQEKVWEEIQEQMETTDRNQSELYNNLPYLDMVISESLRMYPPVFG